MSEYSFFGANLSFKLSVQLLLFNESYINTLKWKKKQHCSPLNELKKTTCFFYLINQLNCTNPIVLEDITREPRAPYQEASKTEASGCGHFQSSYRQMKTTTNRNVHTCSGTKLAWGTHLTTKGSSVLYVITWSKCNVGIMGSFIIKKQRDLKMSESKRGRENELVMSEDEYSPCCGSY